MMVFFVLLTLGFIFELGKNALTIDSRQTSSYNNEQSSTTHVNLGGFGLQSSFPHGSIKLPSKEVDSSE
jgi:hypothetical protein